MTYFADNLQSDKLDGHSDWRLLNKNEVPLLFHEPHIDEYYRLPNQSWSFYLKSILKFHNETLNVWTHIIAVCMTLAQLFVFSCTVDFIHDSYTWPMLAGFLSAITMYICSATAHCLQSRSEYVHYVAYMFDFAGIGLYCFGTTNVHLFYCSDEFFYVAAQKVYIPLAGFIAICVCCCCTVAKLIYTRPYPFTRKLWNITPVAFAYILLISPIIIRIYECFIDSNQCSSSIPYHIQQVIWFLISASFFASECPHNCFSGINGILFHGHTLFHITILICTLFQMEAVFIDFIEYHATIRSRPQPTIASAFLPLAFVWSLELLSIWIFAKAASKKLKAKPN